MFNKPTAPPTEIPDFGDVFDTEELRRESALGFAIQARDEFEPPHITALRADEFVAYLRGNGEVSLEQDDTVVPFKFGPGPIPEMAPAYAMPTGIVNSDETASAITTGREAAITDMTWEGTNFLLCNPRHFTFKPGATVGDVSAACEEFIKRITRGRALGRDA